MQIKKLTKEDISSVSGGAILGPTLGVFYVVSDEHDICVQPGVLAGPFSSYQIASDNAKDLGVCTVMLVPMNYSNLYRD